MDKIGHTLSKDIPYEVSSEMYEIILDRDGRCCRECGSPYDLDLHHIVNRGAGGKSDYCNLVFLCRKNCHKDASAGRGKWSKNFYKELEHLGPVQAYIHENDFTKISCIIHNEKLSIGITT